MLLSLAFLFLTGLVFASNCQRLRLPRIIGMLFAGILLGPFALNLLDGSLLGISAELRQMALVIILIKGGLSLDIRELKAVGRPALLMAFLPALFEIAAFVIFAPPVLGVNRVEAAIMGAVMGAVSPAVVVPRMVQLMDEGYGTDKQIPQMILAGASLDDVLVIVLFSTFVGIGQGEGVKLANFVNIPLSIISGLLTGALAGFAAAKFFEACHKRSRTVRNSIKVIALLSAAFLLMGAEKLLEGIFPMSGLLAVMSMAMTFAKGSDVRVTERLKEKYGKLWLLFEVLLFVLVGAAVDVRYTMQAGAGAVLLIALGLLIRSLGVFVCMLGTKLTLKERVYCVIAYLPKATVQAAIGGVPLALGLSCGNIVLSCAVLAILITAPLGAILMDGSYKKLLRKNGRSA